MLASRMGWHLGDYEVGGAVDKNEGRVGVPFRLAMMNRRGGWPSGGSALWGAAPFGDWFCNGCGV